MQGMMSDSISNLSKALIEVQKELKNATKSTSNPFFKSKYADLETIRETCQALLSKNDLAISQVGNAGFLRTMLIHSSGEWIASDIAIVAKDMSDPQKLGSSITYARRYGLAAILGMATEDDDGNSGASAAPPKKLEKDPLAQEIEIVEAIIRGLDEEKSLAELRAHLEDGDNGLISVFAAWKKIYPIVENSEFKNVWVDIYKKRCADFDPDEVQKLKDKYQPKKGN